MNQSFVTRAEAVAMIQAAIGGAYAGVGFLNGAFGNGVYAAGQTIGNPGAAPTSYIYQAAVLTARQTGVFLCGWGVPFNSGTSADSITLATKTSGWTAANWAGITTTGKQVLTGATAVGVAAANVGNAVNGGSPPNIYQCTAAGTGITNAVTGASSTTVTQKSSAYGTLTGLLTTNGMQWEGDAAEIQNTAANTKVPFAVGSPVVIEWLVTATDSVSMTGSGNFWAFELPVA